MSLEQPIILLQIIFIDIVMAADNAIIIGLIAASYSPDNRKKIIAFGVAAAFIFRVVFALSATFLLTIPWMKLCVVIEGWSCENSIIRNRAL